METIIYTLGEVKDEELKFAVIVAKFNDKYVYVKHKDRTTWEIPGGHREVNEKIDETAKRELREETGATKFNIEAVCDYSVEKAGYDSSYGRVYYAKVEELGTLPDLEIGEVKLFDGMPEYLTYPEIQPFLLEAVEEKNNRKK
ncbi:NUDIX hydrolase [Oceanirhabdus sp. W0125-5]|uniref:NUDIX hydrolase n=1 Tax=Oceanirhabdus sp. W0125-5 TaxID=2999116 RepID=UPI0022F30BAC|nr:NUDIX domain-containing protein [Oceanirhabdus sp. W0125-5]WBW98129.1 NUDIX domain-containing protein [Oceanirhabdus sp. W0125-5]